MSELRKYYTHTHTHTHTHIHTMEYNSVIKKQWTTAICSDMYESREYYAQQNKSDRERQILCDITSMWNLK